MMRSTLFRDGAIRRPKLNRTMSKTKNERGSQIVPGI